MSDRDDPGLDELERHLDAAFATTRPRRDFEDELWRRLAGRGAGRRPAWRFPWAAAGGLAAVLVVALGVGGLVVRLGHGGGGAASTTSGTSQAAPALPGYGSAAGTAPQSRTAGAAPLGRLPAPAAAGVPEVVTGAGGLSPLPVGRASLAFTGTSPPPLGPTTRVFSYDPAVGPADGAIVEVADIRPGLRAAEYPSRQAGDGLTEAATRAAGASQAAPADTVTLTAARLVYVAVVSGGQGYLEPAYLFTGTLGSGGSTVNVQVLVPAVAAASLR